MIVQPGRSPADILKMVNHLLIAAGRELAEETGAEEFKLHCVATYSVEKDGRMGYGRLFIG